MRIFSVFSEDYRTCQKLLLQAQFFCLLVLVLSGGCVFFLELPLVCILVGFLLLDGGFFGEWGNGPVTANSVFFY
jgi:hypothetical protein